MITLQMEEYGLDGILQICDAQLIHGELKMLKGDTTIHVTFVYGHNNSVDRI